MAEPHHEQPGKTWRLSGKIEYTVPVKVSCASPYEPQDRADHHGAEYDGNLSDLRDPPVEQRHDQNNNHDGDGIGSMRAKHLQKRSEPARFPGEIGRIVRKSECSRGNAQRPLKNRLPDIKERN